MRGTPSHLHPHLPQPPLSLPVKVTNWCFRLERGAGLTCIGLEAHETGWLDDQLPAYKCSLQTGTKLKHF
ncbi:hypothetical protein E2C01_042572 [Portunus trituberculatus]|uniref:Uncharacterized protein n=1 Tax=Portunus trituberculatus TaxID=210409 RepID=A0A5B7FTZ0_PORTR|nr:hypothetical protein [Portunus trituberculatus]